MEYIYNFCGNTMRLSEAIRDKFPAFLGVVTSHSKRLGSTIIRINYGIWESDKPTLDEIVASHQTKIDSSSRQTAT
jgi:hypothetical protein